MKVQAGLLAIASVIGMAMAQDTPPAQTPPAKSDASTQAGAPSSKDKPAEMKTTSFKGVLVDLSCSGGSAATTAQTAATTASTASSTNSANRSAADSSSCPVTASSTQLGLKMDSGQVAKFDLVGNQRAVDELKNNKKWSKDISENKPLKVKISGVMSGDKLIVSSIH